MEKPVDQITARQGKLEGIPITFGSEAIKVLHVAQLGKQQVSEGSGPAKLPRIRDVCFQDPLGRA
jgi:hypothetical protein